MNEWLAVKIHTLLGMGDPESRGEERGQAVKFNLGTESFAGTSHADNNQVSYSLFEFRANAMFLETLWPLVLQKRPG